jgi:diguanylate cyclase (GGDEF)-like protein/PAS domain S-box-containing protein
MSAIDRKIFYKPYLLIVVAIGLLIVVNSLLRLQARELGWPLLLLALITVAVASRIVVKFFRFDCSISISDVFIFLALLMFGAEAAILIGAAESFYSSTRVTRKRLTMAFNAAAMACSTFVTAVVVNLAVGNITDLRHGAFSSKLITATALMALTQYSVNSGLVSVATALWTNRPVLATWRNHYLWTSLTYFAGASAAGITVRLIEVVGFYAFISLVPIIAIVYFTYLTYVKNSQTSAAQAETEKRFHQAFDNAPIGMALISLDGRWLQVNGSLCKILGFSETELFEKKYQSIIHPADLVGFNEQIEQVIGAHRPSFEIERRFVHRAGHEIWALVGVSLLDGASNDQSHLILQIQDITARKRAEEQLLHEAYHDVLTGLPNRAWFAEQLKRSLTNREENFAVLFLDLDRFKIINDSIGHIFGDQLLIGLADRLKRCVRPGDKVARLGGDEFTVLLNNITKLSDIEEIVTRIQTEIATPFKLCGYETSTTASIGIAFSSDDYNNHEELLRDADIAMYRAKALGKAHYVMFDKGMHVRAMNLLQVETELRQAIDKRELMLQYQPIVSLENGKLCGFEALVRWDHPQRGLIPPDKFISVAEETGLIVPLGDWVLFEACRQMKEWEREFSSSLPISMSVNLSSRQFAQANLLEQILQTLHTTGIDPNKLKLEITETVVMENVTMATEMLEHLRSLGIQLSIDDFGTGYSSLSYLHSLPIDTLKIDRSFVSRMNENNDNKEIVRTIILLAQNLGLAVIAEGVETREQVAMLNELKCNQGQGFFFARPLATDAAGKLIETEMTSQPNTGLSRVLFNEDLTLPLANTYPM